MYSLQTLRKKAYDVNHRIEKGYQRYHRNNDGGEIRRLQLEKS